MSDHVPPAKSPELPPIPPQVVPEPLSESDEGFARIFDGVTLKRWDGDPVYWRVENGALVGETTEQNLPTYNSFIIWRGGRPADFELKIDYRISLMGNSGLQYRSEELSGVKWVLRGCQSDIDGAEWGKMFYEQYAKPNNLDIHRVTGQNYEERGRAFLALLGQLSYVGAGKTQRVLAALGDHRTLLNTISDDWNRAHLIVRDNFMIHILNDHVMSIVIDDDDERRQTKGALGMQVHVGPPMKAEFRNIRLRIL